MLAQITREVAALPEAHVRQLAPIMAEARRELAADLAKWLKKHPDGAERFTGQRYAEALLQLDTALSVIRTKLPGEMLDLLGEQGDAAAALALKNLKKQVVLHANHFGGEQRALPARTAALVERGTALLMPRYQQTLVRYGADGVESIKRQLAVGMLRGETFEEMKRRLVKNAGGTLAAGWSPTQVADSMARGFMSPLHSRAERIVRTEGINTYNALTDQGIDDLEADDAGWMKKWDAARDRVCPVCRGLDGNLVIPGGGFAAPPDERGVVRTHRHPPAHPNCRCALVAWRREWEKSAPAPKKPNDSVTAPKNRPLVSVPPAPAGPVTPAPAPTATKAPPKLTVVPPAPPAWAAALTGGDYTAARGDIADQARARYGLQPRHAEPGPVTVTPISARGQYYMDSGKIELAPDVAAAAQRFGELGADARAAAFAAIRAGKPPPAGFLFEDLEGMRTLAHETMHGFSPTAPEAMRGMGLMLEEVTTEVMARRFMVDATGAPRGLWYATGDAPNVTPMGGYRAEVDQVVAAVHKELGGSLSDAVAAVEAAAIRMKGLPSNSLRDEAAVVAAFSEGLPAKARGGLAPKPDPAVAAKAAAKAERDARLAAARARVEAADRAEAAAAKAKAEAEAAARGKAEAEAKLALARAEAERAAAARKAATTATPKQDGTVTLPPPPPYDYTAEERAKYKRDALGEVADSRAKWDASTRKAPPRNDTPYEGLTVSEREFHSVRKDFVAGLSSDEIDACLYYSHMGDRVLNSAHRYGMLDTEPDVRAMSDKLSGIISRYKMPKDTHVTRGLGGKFGQDLGALLKPGDTFSEPGFTSTSAATPGEYGGEVMLRIKVPKGAHAAPIPTRYDEEYEFLLPPGTKFRVLSNTKTGEVNENGQDVYHIEVEVIP